MVTVAVHTVDKQLTDIHMFTEAICVQGPRMHKAIHGPEFSTQAREDSPRPRLLRQQETQGGPAVTRWQQQWWRWRHERRQPEE